MGDRRGQSHFLPTLLLHGARHKCRDRPRPTSVSFSEIPLSLILKGMLAFCRSSIVVAVFAAVGVLAQGAGGWAQPLGFSSTARTFDLSDTVQLDRVDQSVLAQLERVKACLADQQWDEAVDTLCRLSEAAEAKLVAVTQRRYLNLRDFVQMRLAALPPPALKRYRDRVDPAARKWYEAGLARRQRALLQKVVDEAFASSYGDKALMALGEMDLESSDPAAARWCWERILPNRLAAGATPAWPSYPDTKLDLATVRARLVLASILEGSPARARAELAAFAALHPEARGRLGGRDVNYTEALASLLAASAAATVHRPGTGSLFSPTMFGDEPSVGALPGAEKCTCPRSADWPTFAGSPQRNRVAPPLIDVGAVVWRRRLRPEPSSMEHAFEPIRSGEDPQRPLSFQPLVIGRMLLINDADTIKAFRLDRGGPMWADTATIFQSQLSGAAASAASPAETLGTPRFTMTAYAGRLFARMGSAVTSQPPAATALWQRGYLVCLDLNAQGRLLWRAEPDEGWAFEGSPVVDDDGVYLAMRRSDIRPQAFVACLDPETGRLRWRCFLCGADTPARGALYESTHNLLTLVGHTLYCNTNLGAVAAVRADDGRLLWVSLYPRARHGDLTRLAPHWRRDLNPCVYDRGTLLVAPADSPRILAFEAATGQMLWQTDTQVADALHLLGATRDWLIAGGRRLYWIGLKDANQGRVKHVWPDSSEGPGAGRGLLAGKSVLWPTRDNLYVFDQETARPEKRIDLAARGVHGGNLLVAGGRLVVATSSELVVLGTMAGGSPNNNQLTSVGRQD